MPVATAPAPMGHEKIRLGGGGPLDGCMMVIERGTDELCHVTEEIGHVYRRLIPTWREFAYVGAARVSAADGK